MNLLPLIYLAQYISNAFLLPLYDTFFKYWCVMIFLTKWNETLRTSRNNMKIHSQKVVVVVAHSLLSFLLTIIDCMEYPNPHNNLRHNL